MQTRASKQLAAHPWWEGEQVVFLHQVPELLPPRSNGRRISTKTAQAWARVGYAGVILRTFCVGRARATTREELARWQQAVTLLTGVAR